MGFTNANVALTLPKVALQANTIDLDAALPSLSLLAIVDTAYANITLPSLQVEAVIDTAYADVTLPLLESSGEIIAGYLCTVDAAIPALKVSSSITAGEVFNISASLPLLEITASGGKATTAFLTLPALEISAIMEPLNQWDMVASLPSIYSIGLVESSGGAVGAITNYVVWVANKKTGAHSNYSSWNVNSYGVFNGNKVVALPDGLYIIDGDLDGATPINAKVYWTSTDLASHRQKRIDSLSVNMRSLDQSTVKFVAVADEQQRRTYLKTLTARPEGLHRYRQLMPKGLNGENWQFGFENVDGGNFALDEVEVISVELSRRFK